jgi:hypothetical protein
MAQAQAAAPIPDDVALALCEETRAAYRGRWYTVQGLWCLGCARFSREPMQRCFSSASGNRGCPQVNRRFDERPGRVTPHQEMP